MKVSRGVIYRTPEDIVDMLYKPMQAKYLETLYERKQFRPEQLPEGLRWKYNTTDLRFFSKNIFIEAIPHEIITYQVHLGFLLKMKNHPLLTLSSQPQIQEEVEAKIEEIRNLFGHKEYMFSMEAEKIEEQPCFVWIWESDPENNKAKFLGVFSGLPIQLLEGPLSPTVIYDCFNCDDFTEVDEDLPDYYYDKDNKHYCSKCASKLNNVKHVGE